MEVVPSLLRDSAVVNQKWTFWRSTSNCDDHRHCGEVMRGGEAVADYPVEDHWVALKDCAWPNTVERLETWACSLFPYVGACGTCRMVEVVAAVETSPWYSALRTGVDSMDCHACREGRYYCISSRRNRAPTLERHVMGDCCCSPDEMLPLMDPSVHLGLERPPRRLQSLL